MLLLQRRRRLPRHCWVLETTATPRPVASDSLRVLARSKLQRLALPYLALVNRQLMSVLLVCSKVQQYHQYDDWPDLNVIQNACVDSVDASQL